MDDNTIIFTQPGMGPVSLLDGQTAYNIADGVTYVKDGSRIVAIRTKIPSRYVQTNDPRLSDRREPLTHNQGAETITTGTLDGDRLPDISATKKGAVPPVTLAAGKFLRDDGTWQVVSTTGSNSYFPSGW